LLGDEQQSCAGATQRTNKQAQKNKTMVINTNQREAKESKGAQWWLKARPQLKKTGEVGGANNSQTCLIGDG
jgi:hypothetical protein